ncbi:unnamed protein product [Amoebophrya sp. A120]|nr:unnamed protein product [Amoebophrya sp. A120]|eukprot:GSA120T00011404001.1
MGRGSRSLCSRLIVRRKPQNSCWLRALAWGKAERIDFQSVAHKVNNYAQNMQSAGPNHTHQHQGAGKGASKPGYYHNYNNWYNSKANWYGHHQHQHHHGPHQHGRNTVSTNASSGAGTTASGGGNNNSQPSEQQQPAPAPPSKPQQPKSVYKYVPGDWICPTCEDLQFRRNQACRICGTMNPMVLAQELAIVAGVAKSLGSFHAYNAASKDTTASSDNMVPPAPLPQKGKGKQAGNGNMIPAVPAPPQIAGVPAPPQAPLWDYTGMPPMTGFEPAAAFGFAHPNMYAVAQQAFPQNLGMFLPHQPLPPAAAANLLFQAFPPGFVAPPAAAEGQDPFSSIPFVLPQDDSFLPRRATEDSINTTAAGSTYTYN